MRSFLLIGFWLANVAVSLGQTVPSRHTFQVLVGYGRHQSLDNWGPSLTGQYGYHFSLRWSACLGLSVTMHDRAVPMPSFVGPQGDLLEVEVRQDMLGVQLAPQVGYSLLRRAKHQLSLLAGPLLRYQSSSVQPITVFPPRNPDFPLQLFLTEATTPQYTLALGGVGQVMYQYYLGQRWLIGGWGAYQIDTVNSQIVQGGVLVGVRL
ncbi:MAG: hypothetical protein MUC97_01070 [Bernardetiaceae bacterium]|jgi:hypothetical protein|nr:hypothetical protein [Bernardetiaceae bacterium]